MNGPMDVNSQFERDSTSAPSFDLFVADNKLLEHESADRTRAIQQIPGIPGIGR